MKVQIYAKALAGACERYLAAFEASNVKAKTDFIASYILPKPHPPIITGKYIGWWIFRRWIEETIPQPDKIGTLEEAQRQADIFYSWQPNNKILILQAIARHKRPETMFEMTDEELAPIAKYLSEFEPERI